MANKSSTIYGPEYFRGLGQAYSRYSELAHSYGLPDAIVRQLFLASDGFHRAEKTIEGVILAAKKVK